MTKISNQYSLTNILTADLANSRLGINNVSPVHSLDVTGTARITGNLTTNIASGLLKSVSNILTQAIAGTDYQSPITLTTTGTSGAATFSSNTLNIPNYGSALSGYLALTGGTLTGALIGTSATFSSTITSQVNGSTFGTASATGRALIIQAGSTNQAIMFKNTANGDGTLFINGTSTTVDYNFNTYSIGDALVIKNSGNIGIGTSSPSALLHLTQNTSNLNLYLQNTNASGKTWAVNSDSTGSFNIHDTTTNRLTITSAGNVGIGTTSPSAITSYTGLSINNATNGGFLDLMQNGVTAMRLLTNGSQANIETKTSIPLIIFTNDTERMRITSGGNVGIGTTTPGVKLEVNGGGAAVAMTIATSGATTAGCLWDGGGAPSFHAWSRPDDCGIGSNNFAGKSILIKTGMTYGSFTTGTTRIEIQSGGAVVIPGSLSKGSGSFRIDHPLKPDTHQLVHSFIEGPQADLIYRGKLTLVNGKAQANIDEVSTMTEGTFEALCREVQCFTTNENGWDLVKGKVIGNIIYIESQNPNSTDEISWMVIGERKDKHMMDTEWTDEQGKVIVEPLKA